MNLKNKAKITAFTLAATLLAAMTPASAIIITDTTPTWNNPVGGNAVVLNKANGNFTDVRWGNGSPQSGLGFDPATSPSIDEPVGPAFLVGTLRHYNNPIAGGAATSVDLSLKTTIQSANPAIETFSYRFLVDETPNVAPCAYPSTTPCADKISFTNLNTSAAFNFGGTNYTLALSGFSLNGGTTISTDFISQEGTTNSIGLYGRFQAATPVPEPATLALLGGVMLAAGMIRRRSSI